MFEDVNTDSSSVGNVHMIYSSLHHQSTHSPRSHAEQHSLLTVYGKSSWARKTYPPRINKRDNGQLGTAETHG